MTSTHELGAQPPGFVERSLLGFLVESTDAVPITRSTETFLRD